MKYCFSYHTAIGKLYISTEEASVIRISFAEDARKDVIREETDIMKQTFSQLEEYLKGERTSFDLQLNPAGTPYQRKVWSVLSSIPYGEVWSYKRVAEAAGNPKASRAVGMANNKNPIMIVIPCHRVIGANGKLVGYAGGLEVKERLLKLENHKISVL